MKPPFIVAEMSANHLGDYNRAFSIVLAAAQAGADAIKFQTWTRGTMCISDYRIEHGPWSGRLMRDLYAEAWTPWEWHKPLFDYARHLGLVPFSAAFDWQAVDFLESLGVDRHKVASFELTDLPLINYMASKNKPMILSCGMATEAEIEAAYWETRNCPLTWLKCTSAYPAGIEQANLRTIPHMLAGTHSNVEGIGLSDHTMTNDCAIVATALGATMIEKHLTLLRSDGGPDAGFSLEPDEFADMVRAVKRAAAAMGEVKYGPQPGEDASLRRSLWVKQDISPGQALRLGDNVVTARPALGMPCSTPLTGKQAARALKAGTPLRLEDIE